MVDKYSFGYKIYQTMTRSTIEAGDKIIEGTFSEAINLEEVCRAINEDPECLRKAEIANRNGSLKLKNGQLVFLEILREKFKNKKSVTRVVTDAVLEIYAEEYQDEGEEVLKVALEKYDKYYVENLAGDKTSKNFGGKSVVATEKKRELLIDFSSLLKGDETQIGTPFIENMVTIPVRPFMFLTERGRDAMRRISNENLERLVLSAMEGNDETRSKYLARQASQALGSLKNFGVEEKWIEFYKKSMKIQYPDGGYPEFASIQGFEKFLREVYLPLVKLTLSTAEIGSVMGDKAAVDVVSDLEAKMEILLAEKRAEVAEKVQPAQRRVDKEVMITKAESDLLYIGNEDRLKRAKKIRNELAVRTLVAPLSAAVSEGVEAISEVGPSLYKGFAEFLKRWQDQEGGDPKLVAVTSGGLALGLVGGAVGAFTVSWLVFPVAVIVLPTSAAAGYMALRGFLKNESN